MEKTIKSLDVGDYLQKAKNYLNNIQKQNHQNIMEYGYTSMNTPYSDPSWKGLETARMMQFQDFFRPTGVDRSNEAMSDIGQSLADKLQGGFASPAEQAQAVGSMNRLQNIGNKRGINFAPQSVSDYLRLVKGGY